MTAEPIPLKPVFATAAGIAMLSLMDAFMKSASLAMGAYMAALLRAGLAFAIIAPVWLALRPEWPSKAVMRVHLTRGAVGSMMALTFFYALTKLPLAETIAISFVAPIVSLYLAALLLGEQVRPRAIWGAIFGLAGVLIIVSGKFGRGTLNDETLLGLVSIIVSALLYAWNLVLQRQQALVAKPLEVATFYMGIAGSIYLVAAPFLFVMPPAEALRDVGIGAALTVAGALTMAWAYARAQAQVLVPLEYSGFVWAALFGWLLLGEAVTWTAAGGALLIVGGCWIATTGKRPEQAAI
ncbi:DMT family transporter [Qipengyuania sp. XHP0207]|uniref:DMT family transporter n=1 Tax=Qipengyuania sp. XHP0207 TaxID=3038078 RepID=UPI00241E362B|nr:DMT family transporter [Qipengyuania sp. XHP0207]MDG5746678.1 DMT family transporter [Qipengyuania sp. XHP0207]